VIADNKFLGLDYNEHREKLNIQFSTPKAVRTRRSILDNKLNVDNVLGIEGVVDEVQAQFPKDMTNTNESFPDLPPFNLKATAPIDVFPLITLIPREEINMITDPEDYISHLGESKDIIYERIPHCPKFVLKLLGELPVKDTQEIRIRCTNIKYYTHLFNFYKVSQNLLKMKYRKKFEEYAIPKPLAETFLAKFGTPTINLDKSKTYQLTLDLKNKLINHILIVALTLNNYRLHIPDMEIELGIQHRRLVTHFRRIGCKVDKKNTAQLITPPHFASLLPGKKY